jgi:hypothetical protein
MAISCAGLNLHVNSLELKHYNEPRKKDCGVFLCPFIRYDMIIHAAGIGPSKDDLVAG